MTMILENSGGPGSSVTLDPEVISWRNKYLKALDGKSFDEMNEIIKAQLENEKNDISRLSLLAARVYLLRVRTLELKGESIDNVMPWSEKIKPKTIIDGKKSQTDEKNINNSELEWQRLRMIESGEVNGVRFPPGIVIDVNKSDGDKLVESGKAEIVEVQENEKEVEQPDLNVGEEKNNNEEGDGAELNAKKIEDKVSVKDEIKTEDKKDVQTDSENLKEENGSDFNELAGALGTEDKKNKKE